MELTIKQAFFAMFYLLDTYFDNGYESDLGGLLGAINPYLFDGDMPADTATFDEWKSCISEVSEKNDNSIKADGVYKAIIKFLEFYSTEFGFNLEDIINDVKKHRISNESVCEVWSQCVEKALGNQ
jgi:hypothetical protein